MFLFDAILWNVRIASSDVIKRGCAKPEVAKVIVIMVLAVCKKITWADILSHQTVQQEIKKCMCTLVPHVQCA